MSVGHRWRWGATLLAAVALCACGDDDGTEADAGMTGADAGPFVCDPAARPAPGDSCITDPCGNEIGVGMTCEAGTNECMVHGFSGAFICTLDFEPGASLNICVRACVNDEECGSGAVCAVDPDNPTSGSGCIPTACT